MDERDYLLSMSSRDFNEILGKLENTRILDLYPDVQPEIHAIKNRIRRICIRLDLDLADTIKKVKEMPASKVGE